VKKGSIISKVPSTDASAATHGKAYHCGTLTYTKAGLVALFGWLLWGDFCFTLMEAVVPSVVPLKLKDLGCSNWLMGLILTTGPSILNMTVCPYVSFKSDRYRSRWGRRIPFIVWTMPFLCIFLALLGWSDDITLLLQKNVGYFRNSAPATLTIGLIAVFMIMFAFFNMFVGSVFWYLFNDVVPAKFIGRFVGMFRIVGTGAGALYSYFIFKFAESNMREILIGASVLYFIGFGLMCVFVREGQYPPFEEEDPGQSRKGMKGLKSFFKESFTHKLYWFMFIFTAFQAFIGSIGMFNVFFRKNMGLSLDQIGKLGAITAAAGLVAMYFAAIFIDRWHPLRVAVYLAVFSVITAGMNWVWVFVELPAVYFFWLTLGIGLITVFQAALAGGCGLPLFMRLFPQSRFGQFCSAAALVCSFGSICAGVMAGMFIDFAKWWCHDSDFGYRFIFIWTTVFSAATALFFIMTYRKWYSMGGDAHYHPPAPWSEGGIEKMEIVTTIGPQSRWLRLTFRMFHATMALSVLGIVPLLWWMHYQHVGTAFYWHVVLLLPLSLTAWICWVILEKRIWRDVERARTGEILHNGIPHHGLLIVVASKFLLLLGLWIIQVVICINLKMEVGAIVFTVANVITNFMQIGGVWLMCRVERGYCTVIDKNLSTGVDDLEPEASA
jgi:Na+/melibiose symporter-like transporter